MFFANPAVREHLPGDDVGTTAAMSSNGWILAFCRALDVAEPMDACSQHRVMLRIVR